MNHISIKKLELAFGLTAALLNVCCAFVMLTAGHDGTVKFFNTLLHGLDVTSIIRIDISAMEGLIGIVQTFILGWLVGASVAAIYNVSFKNQI